MKIAYDPQIFFHQRFGGISRYFTRLSESLRELGEEVAIICPGAMNAYLRAANPELVRNCYGTSLVDLLPWRLRRHSEILRRPFIVRTMRNWKPDIVHETYYRRASYAPTKARLVLTVYDMIHERYPGMFPANDPTRENKRIAVNRADHVICISESTRKDLLEMHDVPPEKVSVIHLGFDGLALPTVSEPRPVTQKPYILYVGQRGGYKNFDTLLEAYRTSRSLGRDFDLVAFGGGPFGREEMGRIGRLTAGCVRHAEGDDAVLASLYRHAAAFVYPSLYEGFGLPPLEALSQGCPVVSSHTSSMPEVIGDAAEFFDPGSAAALGASLEKVLHDSAYAADLVERGAQRLKRFSWQHCAGETQAVYNSVLAG